MAKSACFGGFSEGNGCRPPIRSDYGWLGEAVEAIRGDYGWLGDAVEVICGDNGWLGEAVEVICGDNGWLGEAVEVICGDDGWLGEAVEAICGDNGWLGEAVEVICGDDRWLGEAIEAIRRGRFLGKMGDFPTSRAGERRRGEAGPIRWDDGTRYDATNAYWGNQSYILEHGDAGYVIPPPVPGASSRTKLASDACLRSVRVFSLRK